MSLPELFHHQDLFVGCLAIRRVQRHQPGETLIAGQTRFLLSKSDAGEIAALAESLHFATGTGYDLSIQTQALDYESLKRCPALGEDNRCSIHDNRKPSVCSMVPFDALFPERLQHVVSIIPLLTVVAGISEPCRQRVLRYVDNQASLIDLKISLAIQRKNPGDKPTTKELRGFKDAYLKFRPELLAGKPRSPAVPERADAMEKYLFGWRSSSWPA